MPLDTYLAMILPAIGALLVAYSEALGVAHEFAEKHGYEVDPNQELNAHAIAILASAVLGGMIVGGSMSASAVKEGAGADAGDEPGHLGRDDRHRPLPDAVVCGATRGRAGRADHPRRVAHHRGPQAGAGAPGFTAEFVLGVLALLGVLLIDVLEGMLIGLLASLVLVIYRTSRPHISSLGRVPGVPGAYTALERHPENVPVPGVLILRLDSPVVYYNAVTIRDHTRALIAATEPPPRAVVLDAGVQDQLDVTSVDVLAGLGKELQERGIRIYMAEVHAPVVEFAQRVGVTGFVDEEPDISRRSTQRCGRL